MTGRPRRPAGVSVSRDEHLAWLALTEISGPFLTVPVLSRVWPTLEALDKPTRHALSLAHISGEDDPAVWIDWVLTGLLQWGDALDRALDIRVAVAEHDAEVVASFALRDPATSTAVLLGMVTPPGRLPTARVPDDNWPATPADRLALLCRSQDVPLGLVTDGRWWALVWAPRGGVTTTAVFDSITWREAADRIVVRAFKSMLERRRFFGVPDDQRLPALLVESGDNQEEVTEQLGVQVRQAVELLVQAIGRDEQRTVDAGGTGLEATASEVYTGAVTVMMRIVFLLYAEERRLLPSDSPVYQTAYSAARLGEQLQKRADEAGEESLQSSHTGWYRLLALFNAVYAGIDHPQLTLHAYDGSIFDPAAHPWLSEVRVDDQAVLHMLAAVQRVTINRETRTLSFRALDVEQIGYVYEGLLSFDAYRADDVVVGLVGKVGLEEEVRLTDLEAMWDDSADDDAFAAELAATYKSSGIGTARAIAKRILPPKPAEESAGRGRLAAVTAGDTDLVDRLLDFQGLLRDDLRGLPVVILPGALYVTASGLRASTGTHYTPRFLAEQVVQGALEPLIYSPGPLQTADKKEWKPRSSTEILALDVADIAMGSGAFLVAACRYLANALVEAWAREGDTRAIAATAKVKEPATIDTEVDPVVTEARRQVIEHCLYGVDINPMAVEMAKLSLWLVSMDPQRPFTFLDDRLLTGDSLLGITSLEQVETMHLDPKRGREIHQDGLLDLTSDIRGLVQEAAKERQRLAEMAGGTLGELGAKRELLKELSKSLWNISTNADLLVAATLANASKGRVGLDLASKLAVSASREYASGREAAQDRVERERGDWLDTGLPSGGMPREPFHWPIAFPEVFIDGGFSAIVGNPPFLGGQKITGTLGAAYRDHLVEVLADGIRGSADLVAYFLLRVHQLVSSSGIAGMIATDTLAQGATRRAGLDQLAALGYEIFRAVSGEPWPSKSAALHYCVVGTTRVENMSESSTRFLDTRSVGRISSKLEQQSRVSGLPNRLRENADLMFQGSIVLGMGFVLDPDEADRLIRTSDRNREVLFPYLNGQDLNQRVDGGPSRWVINFHDWDESRARTFEAVWEILERDVKPERQRLNDEGQFVLRRPLPQRFWQYAEKRPGLVRAMHGLRRVLVCSEVTKHLTFSWSDARRVFSANLDVFPSARPSDFAVLSSGIHDAWARKYCSHLETRLKYSIGNGFENFPRPSQSEMLTRLGAHLVSERDKIQQGRLIGLTSLYNLLHDGDCSDPDISNLRDVHRKIDEAVAAAYGWNDLVDRGLKHGFHESRDGVRYTFAAPIRQEMLDRLLELNHVRYAAEQAAGKPGKGRAKATRGPQQEELFG
ncbi:Eco57I restriction-modification methylase domain-containing protein [Nakamurella multipartita]|uniref:site-specific DNA-methyltransferase (adenine-specific) n=1 Tax=Nakamurella multipartita (strain ATCC 700099 / DSM 44233 / CIP 104796 / JCM 9543 / NBRC 105858 / Y-104) TaxID=479431 RepID=C8X715_NAKMY|nr:type IIL restriction-modification enzyme MmeI [Nakamurella multipartita]ACV76884.1 hypothetical protein Namu_0465 [Nakamurella multipartita DSM 44233]